MPSLHRPRRAAFHLALAALVAVSLAVPALAAMPDFGPMRTYQIAFIRRGPAWTRERTAATDSTRTAW